MNVERNMQHILEGDDFAKQYYFFVLFVILKFSGMNLNRHYIHQSLFKIPLTLKWLGEGVPMNPTSVFAYFTTFACNFPDIICCYCRTRDSVCFGEKNTPELKCRLPAN